MSEVIAIVRGRAAAGDGTGRALRLRAGIPLRALAAELGVDHSALHGWEAGRHVPNAAHAAAYHRVLEQIRRELNRERVPA